MMTASDSEVLAPAGALSEGQLTLRRKVQTEFDRCLGAKDGGMLVMGINTALRAAGCSLEQLPRRATDLMVAQGAEHGLSLYLATIATEETLTLILTHLGAIKTRKPRAA